MLGDGHQTMNGTLNNHYYYRDSHCGMDHQHWSTGWYYHVLPLAQMSHIVVLQHGCHHTSRSWQILFIEQPKRDTPGTGWIVMIHETADSKWTCWCQWWIITGKEDSDYINDWFFFWRIFDWYMALTLMVVITLSASWMPFHPRYPRCQQYDDWAICATAQDGPNL